MPRLLAKFLSDKLPLWLTLIIFDTSLDIFPPPNPSPKVHLPLFSALCREMGFSDLQKKIQHPTEAHYSCHSKTRNSLSCIDLVLGSSEIFPYITSFDFQARGVSDCSLLLIPAKWNHLAGGVIWKLNSFWHSLPSSYILLLPFWTWTLIKHHNLWCGLP